MTTRVRIAACLVVAVAVTATVLSWIAASLYAPPLGARPSAPPAPARASRAAPAAARRMPPPALPPAATMSFAAPAMDTARPPPMSSFDPLVRFAPPYRPHVASVGAFLRQQLAPRLSDCVRPYEPVGWVEVAHSFAVDINGIARQAVFADDPRSPVELVDSNLPPDVLAHVLACMELAAADMTFEHVPLFAPAPEDGFVAYQGYEFGPR